MSETAAAPAAPSDSGAPAPAADATAPAAAPAVDAPATDAGTAPDAAATPVEAAYEAFKLPDGITFTEQLTTDIQALAKEWKLPQADAQKLADQNLRLIQGIEANMADARTKTAKEWEAQIRADKDIGGDAFAKNIETAKAAVEKFGGEPLKAFLNETGLGNHPEMVRAFVKIAKAISEDQVTSRTGANGANPGTPIQDRAVAAFGWGSTMKLDS